MFAVVVTSTAIGLFLDRLWRSHQADTATAVVVSKGPPSAPTKDIKQWVTQGKKQIFKYMKRVDIEEHKIQIAPETVLDWVWVKLPHFINVAIVTKEGKWILFHQNKYAATEYFGKTTMAPVGGYCEEGEDPKLAAEREMAEEVGYKSDHLVYLGSAAADANRGCGVGHMYVALDAYPCEQLPSDDLEDMEVLHCSTEDVETALLQGKFLCHSWYATMAGALLLYKKERRKAMR